MKSPMVVNADYINEENKGNYSELMVMRSAAGYYVGTIYTEPDGFQEPGSRDSGYFATEEEAAAHLKLIEAGEATTRIRPDEELRPEHQRSNCRGCNRFSMAEFGQFYEFRSEKGWSPDMALFDTDKLNELLKFRPHPVNISPDYEQFQPMVDGHEIFPEHIDHVDETIPIMLGEYEFVNDETGEKRIYHICPDGHHRLAKRIKNKMPIEFYYFTEREMKFCSSTNVLDFLASKGMVIAGISEEEFKKIWHESDPYWKEKNL